MLFRKMFAAILLFGCLVLLVSCKDELSIAIGDDGYWYINGEKTDVSAVGQAGDDGIPGEKGAMGDISKVASCEKTKSTASKDIYTITFTDGTTSTFSVAKATDGETVVVDNVLDSDGNIYNFDKLLGAIGIPGMKYAKADKLNQANPLYIPDSNNCIKDNKHITFTADIESFSEGGKLIIAHGYEVSSGSWLEITDTHVQGKSYYHFGGENNGPRTVEFGNQAHGLNLEGYVTVNIDCNYRTLTFEIITAGGYYKSTLNSGWSGNNGDICAVAENARFKNAEIRWYTDDYSERIWLIGDSSLGTTNSDRWPYYLYYYGCANMLTMGYAGMACPPGVTYFEDALKYGTPTYAVWCLGGNNSDPDEYTPNQVYIDSVLKFVELCKEHNVTPILTTINNTPKLMNCAKNEWIKKFCAENGYRYVDFAKAVNAETAYSGWYDDMLYSDLVHPDVTGAQALCHQFIKDVPEILFTRDR